MSLAAALAHLPAGSKISMREPITPSEESAFQVSRNSIFAPSWVQCTEFNYRALKRLINDWGLNGSRITERRLPWKTSQLQRCRLHWRTDLRQRLLQHLRRWRNRGCWRSLPSQG